MMIHACSSLFTKPPSFLVQVPPDDQQGPGKGTTINVPVPAGSKTYEPVFRQIMAAAADRFQPQLILVSAGFDAHWKEAKAETGLVQPGILLS